MVLANSDSVFLIRFAAESGDDGAAQSRPRSAVLLVDDHLVRKVAAVFDLSWVQSLQPIIPTTVGPRSTLCRHGKRTWPIAGSVDFQSRTISLITLRSHAPAMSGFVTVTFSVVSSSSCWKPALRQALSAAKGLRSMPA